MTIGVDARVLQDSRYSGVSGYTNELLQAILQQDKHNRYVLFFNGFKNYHQPLPEFNQANVWSAQRRFPNKFLNYGLFKTFRWPVTKLVGQRLDLWWQPHFNHLALPKSLPLVLTVHDLSFWRYPEFFSARKNFWHRSVNLPKLLGRADQLIAISEHTKRDLINLAAVSEQKIQVISSGLSPACQYLSKDDLRVFKVKHKYQLPERFILFVGTLEPRKNLPGLILAYNELRRQNPQLSDVQLIIIGANGWKYQEIYQLAQSSPYYHDIKFLGYLNETEKIWLYNLATVFAFPSFYEGFGFPPLEAMACGLPVVCSFASSLPEVAGEAAIMVDPYNPQSLAAAMVQVLNSSELQEQLRAKGLEAVKKFSWQKTAELYRLIFEKFKA